MDGSSSSVKTLIDHFEFMAQVNTKAESLRPWSVAGSKRVNLPSQPKSDKFLVKDVIDRMNGQGARTMLITQKVDDKTSVATTETKRVIYTKLTVKTLASEDEQDAIICNFYEDESDTDSSTKSTYYLTVPSSPSYSTASTESLDSLLSSLDTFLSDLLPTSGDKIIKRNAYRSRRSSFLANIQSTRILNLDPPASATVAPKMRRSSHYTAKNPPPVASTHRLSEAARTSAITSSPKGHSKSTSVARYMDYNSSPRFVAMKTRNLERRRQLEERNHNLTVENCEAKGHRGHALRSSRAV